MIFLWFFYDFFMILGFLLFFIDFPKEFLEIFDFSLIFLEFFFWNPWFFEWFESILWIFLRNFMEFPGNH